MQKARTSTARPLKKKNTYEAAQRTTDDDDVFGLGVRRRPVHLGVSSHFCEDETSLQTRRGWKGKWIKVGYGPGKCRQQWGLDSGDPAGVILHHRARCGGRQ